MYCPARLGIALQHNNLLQTQGFQVEVLLEDLLVDLLVVLGEAEKRVWLVLVEILLEALVEALMEALGEDKKVDELAGQCGS